MTDSAPTLYPLMRYTDAPAAIDDPDDHCRRAREVGAEILAEPFDTDYGSRDYSACDPEGNQWHFGTYRPAAADAPSAAAA